MSKRAKKAVAVVPAKEDEPQPAPPRIGGPRSVPIFFHAEEIGFLINALQNLPISGTPDNLAQVLNVVQAVRMKVAQAGVALGMLQQTTAPDTAKEEVPTSVAE